MSNLTLDELHMNVTRSVITISVFIGIEAVVGFIGNLLIIIVYSGQYRQGNFYYFVLAQAVIDLVSCVTTLPGEVVSQMYWYRYQFNTICKIKTFFNVFTVWGSASTLTVMSFDRYWKITHPLSKQITQSLAVKCCVIVLSVSILVSVPAGFLWGKQTYVYTYYGHEFNVSICEKDERYSNEPYHFIYLVCVYIGPVGLMILQMTFLNVLTAIKLLRNKARDTDMNESPPCSPVEATTCKADLTVEAEEHETMTNDESVHYSNMKDRENHISVYVEKDIESRHDCSCIPVSSQSTDIAKKAKRNSISSSKRSSKRTSVSRPLCFYTNVRSHTGKTVTMFILTTVFTTTTLVYIILSSLVASEKSILRHQSNTNMAVLFLFWRLYFVNCVIDPIIYGVMDPRFRAGLKSLFLRKKQQASEM